MTDSHTGSVSSSLVPVSSIITPSSIVVSGVHSVASMVGGVPHGPLAPAPSASTVPPMLNQLGSWVPSGTSFTMVPLQFTPITTMDHLQQQVLGLDAIIQGDPKKLGTHG